MTTLFVDQLTVIDASRLDEDRGLVGESWIVDVELEGHLNSQGMLLDFGELKRQAKGTIDGRFDHKLLLPAHHPECRIEHRSDRIEVSLPLSSGTHIRHISPACAVGEIPATAVDMNTVAAAIEAEIRPGLPENIRNLRIRLRMESSDTPVFHYSHGLRQHAGACQRIAHGHRSRIEISRDGVRDPQLESRWAERWKDIYIGTKSNLVGQSVREEINYCRFGYRTQEGEFELELPQQCCFLIESDSTVENLARYVADSLKREFPASAFRVRIFEGVGKGAVSEIP